MFGGAAHIRVDPSGKAESRVKALDSAIIVEALGLCFSVLLRDRTADLKIYCKPLLE
jgi:chemotaxis receptor (MCP) glutamine deamidase CheD